MNDAFLLDDWTTVFLHTDIDEMWTQWKSRFFSEVKKFIPCVEPQFSKRPQSRISPPWFNNDTRRLVRAKNRLFKRSGSSEHRKIYRTARNKATTAVKTAKHQHLGCVYTCTDSKVSGYPGRRYPGKCEAFTRIQISGAVVRHACAMQYQHDLRPSFEGQSCLAARYLSGFSVIRES